MDHSSSSSLSYSLFAIKEKPYRDEAHNHYAAYYGLLHKLSHDVTSVLDTLIEQHLSETEVYREQLESMKQKIQLELDVLNDQDTLRHPGDKFVFDSHLLL